MAQSRTLRARSWLLRKARLGEVTVSVWPKVLKQICKKENIHVLE
jgi:aspartate--ammonia ligase